MSNGGPDVGRGCACPRKWNRSSVPTVGLVDACLEYRIDEKMYAGRSELCAQSFQSLLTSSDHVHKAEQRELCTGQQRPRWLTAGMIGGG